MTATTNSFNDNSASPQELGLAMLEELQKTPRQCDYAKVRDLIARGASADVYNVRGEWPLQACICYGHGEIGLLLIEKGADVEFRFPDSRNTPLMLAAHNARVEIVKALLDRGARLETPDNEADTPLQQATSRRNDNEYTIKTLPELCHKIHPDPRVTVVKFGQIITMIQQAADTRAEAEAAAQAAIDSAEAERQQIETDWHNEGLPLRQPLTVSRRTIKLK